MLKVLLSIYVSFITLASYSQLPVPDWTGPSELVVEDPNKNVTDLIYTNNIENGRLLLTWKIASSAPDFFSVERSDNGKIFEVVAVLNNIKPQRYFQWTDEAPKKGRSYYRLRYAFNQGESLYSKTIPVIISDNTSFKFYPNPVDHVLIIRSETPVDVQISDANGKLRISQPNIHGLHTINVSSLETGIYLIRFSNKLTAVMSQEKLIKK